MHENNIINHDHHGQHTNSQACLAYAIKTPPSAADWLATETFAMAKNWIPSWVWFFKANKVTRGNQNLRDRLCCFDLGFWFLKHMRILGHWIMRVHQTSFSGRILRDAAIYMVHGRSPATSDGPSLVQSNVTTLTNEILRRPCGPAH
ncbi:unnamed protein product [Prunus brigantina]